MSLRPLDAARLDLAGQQLIEASAGTGKTWTIAALYLRLVLGHGSGEALLPPQILVLTFTRAATAELRERIRARLGEAALAFRKHDVERERRLARAGHAGDDVPLAERDFERDVLEVVLPGACERQHLVLFVLKGYERSERLVDVVRTRFGRTARRAVPTIGIQRLGFCCPG